MTPPLPGPSEGLNGAVAAELRAERAAQNMTVKNLAAASEVAFASLRRYLAGERHIDVSVLAALCEALSIEPGQIVERAASRLSREPSGERRPLTATELLASNDPDSAAAHNVSRMPRRPDYSSFEEADEAARNEDAEKPKLT